MRANCRRLESSSSAENQVGLLKRMRMPAPVKARMCARITIGFFDPILRSSELFSISHHCRCNSIRHAQSSPCNTASLQVEPVWICNDKPACVQEKSPRTASPYGKNSSSASAMPVLGGVFVRRRPFQGAIILYLQSLRRRRETPKYAEVRVRRTNHGWRLRVEYPWLRTVVCDYEKPRLGWPRAVSGHTSSCHLFVTPPFEWSR